MRWATRSFGPHLPQKNARKADQLDGKTQKVYGEARDFVEGSVRPIVDYARQFARERPFAAAALGGVLGIALINTLRGK